MGSVYTSLVSAIIIFLIFKLLTKVLPSNHSEYKTNKSFYELDVKYNKTKNLMVLGYVLLSVGFSICFYFGFIEFSKTIHSNSLGIIILVLPENAAWLTCAIFTGMVCASLSIFIISMNKLGENWHEFLAFNNLFYNQKFKFNYIKATKYAFKIIIVLITFLLTMVFDWYTSFENNEIKINGFFSFGTKAYDYDEVLEIRNIEKFKAPNGNIINEAHFILVFEDGLKWNTRNSGFKNYHENEKIINLVSDKSGLKPIYMKFDKE